MPRTVRDLCSCGRPQRSKGVTQSGLKLFDRLCWKCRENGYRLLKGDKCEFCGFVPIHPVQLDVDHIDGDHTNNNIDNIQTLCANCHRLKTQMNNDHTWIMLKDA
jgi:5-methylcytosine-specific restriction endonuclease McrA